MVTLQKLPKQMSGFPVDFDHPNRTLICGCFEETVEVRGSQRRFFTYIPEGTENCQQCLVVAPPSDYTPLAYLEDSGLQAFADAHKVFVFLMVPDNGGWKLDGTDGEYMNAVYVKIQARDYYVTMQDNIYAFGAGDGADVAQQAARLMASEWSGLVSVGNVRTDITQVVAGEASEMEQGDLELKIIAQKSQLPVWMIVTSLEGANGAAIRYWREQNKATEEPLAGQGADYIWMPSPVRSTNEVNEEAIAQVRVTLGETRVTRELLETVWRYIGMARRHRGYERKNLRYFKDPAAYGAVPQERVVDGLKRIWYEYIPEACTPDQKWPVVVVMHGRGGTAETFFDISGMANVAKARRFIAVFPQAGLYQQKPEGLKNVLLWDGNYEGKPIDDVKFIRIMMEDIQRRLPADPRRFYACGQSSGGMMTDVLCESASDLFAACASWSALKSPSRMYMEHEPSRELAPTLFIYGDRDSLAAGDGTDPLFPFSTEAEIRETIVKKFQRYHLSVDRIQAWETHPISWYACLNEQGVPMLTVGIVKNMVHANYPEESWISYDQFFCQFWKGEDGELYYRGEKVRKDGE